MVAALAAAALIAASLPLRSGARTPLGVFTSLPLIWNETTGPAEMIGTHAAPPWPRTALETRFRLVPLDTLLKLDRLGDLLIAQPRPLAPQENVALDRWVRRGGHLLLFADPMLTAPSRFAIGDPRRPQDIALLSPILKHWGLSLNYDEAQPLGLREIAGSTLPINLAGHWTKRPGGEADCRIEQAGLVANCRIGAGRALMVADAALFEAAPDPAAQAGLLHTLATKAFTR
ncbi:ABC transporter [Novosphingobium sp. Chol11]|uniref:Gldg family protein n=1 Tax=Novosphingobium sp. Chol11 TaxID=1385763 RepID=UPI0025D3116C|nr:ABC transporter [Novosphingobium sp. Chol11]